MNTDRQIYIAVANSRMAQAWKNKKLKWSELVGKCSKTTRTSETFAEYKAMGTARQSEIKDVGGFVGGYLKNGLRKKGSIEFRDVLTLDIDYGHSDTWAQYCLLFGRAAFCYSTHKYTKTNPRIRLCILLSRSVSSEEYEAVARAVAAQIDIEQFDDTTYQPERLMYWPSTSLDGEYYFDSIDGDALDPDEMLATYHDWHDAAEWPYSSRVFEVMRKSASKQGNPTEKPGIVGAFCRCYDIRTVIEAYLPDVYDVCADGNRYTFKAGTVAAGLVLYDDGMFAYSHNATDPCSQRLVNAFDLVRIHKFIDLDENTDSKTAISNRPSYSAMAELAAKDKLVRRRLTDERRSAAAMDFTGVTLDEDAERTSESEDDGAWKDRLEYKKNGTIANTIANAFVILTNAPEFKGLLWHDDFSGIDRYDGRLPWTVGKPLGSWSNSDDSCLRKHLERVYQITGKERIADALTSAMMANRRHPVRKYLRSLTWDGVERLDTLFIDFLGSEDSEIVRQQTRKQFTAAVARVFNPGCKFDVMLVLVGDEGLGKSTILSRMAGKWFSDSLVNMDGKEGMESIRQAWIIEVGELTSIKKSEVESVKAYLSRQVDMYRPSYGRTIEEYPRQCVFFGTTNERNFLKGHTGNRRFWVIDTGLQLPRMDVFTELTSTYRDQVWAEAVHRYDTGEDLFLAPEFEKEARQTQVDYNELASDERVGIIQRFLDIKLPLDWETRSIDLRRAYFRDIDPLSAEGIMERTSVSAVEILVECFGEKIDDKVRYKTRDINAIMNSMPEWEFSGKERLSVYGQQRVYKKNIQANKSETI